MLLLASQKEKGLKVGPCMNSSFGTNNYTPMSPFRHFLSTLISYNVNAIFLLISDPPILFDLVNLTELAVHFYVAKYG